MNKKQIEKMLKNSVIMSNIAVLNEVQMRLKKLPDEENRNAISIIIKMKEEFEKL